MAALRRHSKSILGPKANFWFPPNNWSQLSNKLVFRDKLAPWDMSHTSKVMLKILQARFQQYVNQELLDVQAGFRKGRGTRDQIANINWIIQKARQFQKNIYFCFIDYAKAFDCVNHNKLWKILKDAHTRPPDLPLEKSVCMPGTNS